MTEARVTVRVPGKINLQLSVGPLRKDGFHELATIYQAVDLCDDVRLTATPGVPLSVTVTGADADQVPTSTDNLAARAVRSVAALVGVEPEVAIGITKVLPVAAGMAGGSADAAAALMAADVLWDARLGRVELSRLAAELGSDVPFLLHGGTAVGTGRGEVLTPALSRGSFNWVFAIAAGGLSTPAVYGELDRLRGSDSVANPEVSVPVLTALAAGDAAALGAALVNELLPAAFALRPQLRQLLDFGTEAGALGATVCGSGPTCAFLVSDEGAGLDLAVALTATGLCRTVRRAAGPVVGAAVVDAVGVR
ncbi:MAG: 4-(cytidine 5'-diphospho)-2-C-methyl-D-erythritol kinase [Actinomycetes bacterium]